MFFDIIQTETAVIGRGRVSIDNPANRPMPARGCPAGIGRALAAFLPANEDDCSTKDSGKNTIYFSVIGRVIGRTVSLAGSLAGKTPKIRPMESFSFTRSAYNVQHLTNVKE